MKSYGIATLASILFAAAANALQINTPTSMVTCQPVQLAWNGGQGPYYVAVIPGNKPGSQPLKQFPKTSDTHVTWNVDVAANTLVSLQVTDNTGAIAYSAAATVFGGSDTSCVNNSSSSSDTSSGGDSSSSASSGGASASSGASSDSPSATGGAAAAAAPTESSSEAGHSSSAGSSTKSSSESKSSSDKKEDSHSPAGRTTANVVGAVAVAGVVAALVA